MLQWGHDKIVMEVNPSFNGPSMPPKLQWGHDKIVMEVSRSKSRINREIPASMGP